MGKHGETQAKIYNYIVGYVKRNGISPTIREICYDMNIRSTSTVHRHIKNLAANGFIDQIPMKQRSITLSQTAAYSRIHLVGSVAAGTPILAEENIYESFLVSSEILRGADMNDIFMLNVKGESMTDIGIHDGDMVIVNRGLSVHNGDIVVAGIKQESATIKRIYLNPDKTVKLQPENSEMNPILLPADEVEIIGKVVGLYRRF